MSFEALGLKPVMPSRVGGTRWIPHLHRALIAWQSGYPAIIQQLTALIHGDTANSKGAAKARHILKSMTDSRIVQFCHLLLDVVFHLKVLSKKCQKTTATVSEVMTQVSATSKTLQKFKNS